YGSWQSSADAVLARIPLESDPKTLRTLHHRLGLIYQTHDDAKALDSFRRALTYKPGDVESLTRVTDLAIRTQAWDVAHDASDQLITAERDPEKLAVAFQRAATIFEAGLGDRKRAEHMLQLALESAPTNTACLHKLLEFYAGDPISIR